MTWVMAKAWGNGTIMRKRVGGKPSFFSALHHFTQRFVNAPPILSGIISPHNTEAHFPRGLVFHLTCKNLIFSERKQCMAHALYVGNWLGLTKIIRRSPQNKWNDLQALSPLRIIHHYYYKGNLIFPCNTVLSPSSVLSVWTFSQQYSGLQGTLGMKAGLILAIVFSWIGLWQCKSWHSSWGIEPHQQDKSFPLTKVVSKFWVC